ncbi:MAG: Gfo/Idh/MocA family oxidoreductase [Actinobacteria bacterium]|nr:Gfo/Idh/MocA family oxidoreductase [Actinomycetota bacterium]
MTAADRPWKVVVCGTTFGQVYLESFRVPDRRLVLAGVLGKGSARSQACANHYGVPLYTDPDQLPDDVDIACVVVRSALLGGRGAELARTLMARGIHVIQEHPLHHDELAACLRTAREHGVVYDLNSFYVHVAPVRRFLGMAHELLRRQPPLYVDAACGFQLAYALLDIVGRALRGVRPWTLRVASADEPDGVPSFRTLEGEVGGVPWVLRVQNQLDPSDPDNHAHLMHRVSIGAEAGNLTLLNTHGPVVWTPRPTYPRQPRDPDAPPHFSVEVTPELAQASAVTFGPPQADSFAELFQAAWPAGVRRALLELRAAALAGEDALRRGQHHLSLCRLWDDITERLGPPDLLRADEPRPLDVDDLLAMEKAGIQAEAMP